MLYIKCFFVLYLKFYNSISSFFLENNMNYYEHTIIARQDTSPSQIKQIQDKYSKIIESNDGNILKFESWGLMQ